MATRIYNAHPDANNLLALIRALVGLAALVLALIGLGYYAYLGYTDLRPPTVQIEDEDLLIDPSGRRVSHGASWIARRGTLWEMHLEGPPNAMGAAHGRLAGRLYASLESDIGDKLSGRYGDSLDAWAERMRLRWDYRNADEALSEPVQSELAALAARLPHPRDRGMSPYHLAYLSQNALELSQRLPDVPTESLFFAVRSRGAGTTTESGKLIVGRNFSFPLAGSSPALRLISFYYPDGKYPFVSVGWAGLIGVVTGVNARGIVVAVNIARSDVPRNENGIPVPLIMRDILERADSLEQALAILRDAPLRNPAAILIGDGRQRKAIVVEATPRGSDSRLTRGESKNVVFATDHLARENFERDAQNDRVKRNTASGFRFDRLEEILPSAMNFSPEDAAAVLRDRRGQDNQSIGLGDPSAIENLLVSHSVIIDATTMSLWVSEGPSTLGRYRAFDLRHRLGREAGIAAPPPDIAPDRILHGEQYNDYLESEAQLEYARRLFDLGRLDDARAAATIARALAPSNAEISRLLGDVTRESGDADAAIEHYQRYLELSAGRVRDRERVLGILDELTR